MNAAGGMPRFEMIIGLHDLADPPVARGDEMICWNAFSSVAGILDEVIANTRRTGVGLRITSDDGFESDYHILMPFLLARGLTGTFFVVTDFLDRPGRLTTSQIREMAGLGMRFGVHGAGHIDWARVPESQFVADITKGRARLEDILGARVDIAAPPFGSYSPKVLAQLFEADYREVHTTRPGLAPAHLPVKPRTILHPPTIDEVLAISRRTGGLGEIAVYHARALRKTLKSLAGAA